MSKCVRRMDIETKSGGGAEKRRKKVENVITCFSDSKDFAMQS